MDIALDDKYKEALEREYQVKNLEKARLAQYRLEENYYMVGDAVWVPYDTITVNVLPFITLTIGKDETSLRA